MTELEKAAASICGVHPDWSKLECFRIGFKEGAEWQAKQSPWISVEDRLPEDGLIDPIAWNVTNSVVVLTSNGNAIVTKRRWNCNLKTWEWKGSHTFVNSIVKWMPIPE